MDAASQSKEPDVVAKFRTGGVPLAYTLHQPQMLLRSC